VSGATVAAPSTGSGTNSGQGDGSMPLIWAGFALLGLGGSAFAIRGIRR
jgi:hypothetical protein